MAKTKKIVKPLKDEQVPVETSYASPLDLSFHGVTEAEYQEPAVPEEPVDPVKAEMADVEAQSKDIPFLLRRIILELVRARIWREQMHK